MVRIWGIRPDAVSTPGLPLALPDKVIWFMRFDVWGPEY